MRNVYLFLVVFVYNSIGFSQSEVECDLLPSVVTNSSVKFHLKEISKEQYYNYKSKKEEQLVLFENSDSIERVFQHKYPKIFKKKDEKYIFKGLDDKDIFVGNNLTGEKTYAKYEFKAQYKDYVIIHQQFYESGRSVLVDVKNNKSYTLEDKPYFITDTLIYSVVLGYHGTELSIIDTEKKEKISLLFSYIELQEVYNLSNHIRIKVRCMKSKEIRYIEVLKI